MIPVLTPEEMKAVDEAAPEPVDVLVARAGTAVARAALRLLGGAYGRRVVVVAGKGNNGADGRYAAVRLRRAGVRVTVLDAAGVAPTLPPADLVIDAAYGTGFRGDYPAPDPAGARVLAVDIPSGVDGLTGEAAADAVRADATVTFAALKPGLLLGAGPERAGAVELVDIGLDVSGARMHVVEHADVGRNLPGRPRDAHKWQSAVLVLGGSAGMTGAPVLAGRSALRAGAGNVRLGIPGAVVEQLPPSEMVNIALPADGWAAPALEAAERCRSMVLGPGLGLSDAASKQVRRVLQEADMPVVVDADALSALDGPVPGGERRVLTPHVGEFRKMTGHPPGADRVAAVRELAERTGSVVLLKGSTTVVARPSGEVRLVTSGGPRLATAGSGDVLSGVIGAFLACGLDPFTAASLGAHVHGAATSLAPARGMVAGDLVELLPQWLSAHA